MTAPPSPGYEANFDVGIADDGFVICDDHVAEQGNRCAEARGSTV